MRHLLRDPLHLIRTHLRAYLLLNLLAYGLVLLGAAAGLVFPSLTAGNLESMQADGTTADVVAQLSRP